VAIRPFLVALRDRIVQRSQIGKEKIEVAFARRALDQRMLELGERYYAQVRSGAVTVPDELRSVLAEIEELARKLDGMKEQVQRLENEVATQA
jgi:predicted  nucleic acid-binding Zn-ribbon protein